MKTIFIVLSFAFLLVACSTTQRRSESNPRYYLKTSKDTDGVYEKGATGMKVVDVKNRQDTFDLNSNTFLSASHYHIIEMIPEKSDGKNVFVVVYLTREGADIYAELTEKNIGKEIHFVINDKVVFSSKIMAKITAGDLYMRIPKNYFKKHFRQL